MTPSGDGYPIDLVEEIIDLAGSFLEADRGSQCRAETHACVARDHEYKRLGTLSLLAGIDLLTGQVHATVEDRHRSREFVGFLKKMDAATRRVPRSRSFWTIIQRTCRRRPKSGLPHSAGAASASCLRQSMAPGSSLVEGFFSKMARSVLRRIRVASKAELKQRIIAYLDDLNREPVVPHLVLQDYRASVMRSFHGNALLQGTSSSTLDMKLRPYASTRHSC